MPIYALGESTPTVHPDAYVHPDAVVIGDVTLMKGASVWPCAVLRGDFGRIRVGTDSSIQDGTIVHAGPSTPTVVGNQCIVGHSVHLEGCKIGNGSLIGSMSTVMRRVEVGKRCVVAVGSVVTNDTNVPDGQVVMGTPARIVDLSGDIEELSDGATLYRDMAARYSAELRRID